MNSTIHHKMAKAQSTAKRTTSKTGANGSAGSKTAASGKQHKTLNDLLEDGLKDILSAEKQLVEALPEMAQAAYSEELQDAFEKHLEQTKRHVERVQKVMSRLNISTEGEEQCEAMEGLIAEGKEIIENYEPSPVRDSALIIAAQKVEHYEIASYGSLCELCDVLGYSNLHDILGRTLDEEEDTDQDLTDLAQDINDEAHELSLHEEAAAEDNE
jgi:ferritin-like metal-binding protein YciE